MDGDDDDDDDDGDGDDDDDDDDDKENRENTYMKNEVEGRKSSRVKKTEKGRSVSHRG